jgi:hypothetical protein
MFPVIKLLNMPSATAQKMPRATSEITSRIDPRMVDVKPPKGSLTNAAAERIMRRHGLHPMTATEKRRFASVLRRRRQSGL